MLLALLSKRESKQMYKLYEYLVTKQCHNKSSLFGFKTIRESMKGNKILREGIYEVPKYFIYKPHEV